MSNMHCALRGGRLLLRMRPHPLPARRPFIPIAVRFVHRPRNKKGKPLKVDGPLLRLPETIEEVERMEGPLTEEQINDPDAIPISIYEQDPTSPTGERLIQHLRTPEERRKHNELHKMMMEAENDPNYNDDNPELNRHLLDELMKDPYFADLTDELKDIKENLLLTTQQQEQMIAEAEAAEESVVKEEEAAHESMVKEIESAMQLANYESVQELMDDPDFAYAREELAELQDVLPELGGDDAEYQAAVDKVLKKLGEDPKFEQAMAAWEAEHGKSLDENADGDALLEEPMKQEEHLFDEPEDLSKLLGQMKDLMGSMGNNDDALNKLEAEMEKVLNENPEAEDLEDEDLEDAEFRAKEMSFTELGKELLQLAKSNPEGGVKSYDEDEDGEPVDPALEAKVDEIMKDPKLMEKLMYIQKIITEEQQKQAQIQSPMELAPDPTKLEPHRITSIKQRIQVARSDPEHRAALQALRVNLLPPFNIAPALRIFNEAIEYAYIGANDDIRRILWRAYSKARSLPTFLQNLSDDAWDILYYSQAVTWGSNQNREAHLRLLLQDLQSVGKDGPPTHPDAIAEMQKQ